MFSPTDDIRALRRLKWGLATAILLMTVFFSARLYLADGDLGWLEIVVMTIALLVLAVFAAAISGHLVRLKKEAYLAAKQRRSKHMEELSNHS